MTAEEHDEHVRRMSDAAEAQANALANITIVLTGLLGVIGLAAAGNNSAIREPVLETIERVSKAVA